jgi:hypothetical protein
MSVSASGVPGILAAQAGDIYLLRAPGQDSIVSEGATAVAGIQINQNTIEYVRGPGLQTLTSLGEWTKLATGNGIWAQYIPVFGTTGWNVLPGPVANRFECSTTRDWYISRSTVGVSTITGYFQLWDAETGGNLLHQTDTATWRCEVESNN